MLRYNFHFELLVLVLVGDSRVSAISQSPSKSSQPISANINNPALFYSSSSSSPMNNLHRKRRNSNNPKEGIYLMTKKTSKISYLKLHSEVIINFVII